VRSEDLVSVVLIFLNEERFIQEAIDSVFSQTYRHWELLLVDDGSGDNSSAIARRVAEENVERVRYL
jgi:glycosyltransferase involved in cell wall biosynthesis